MNLENFKKDYLKIITESTDEDLKNYIRSVVKDTLAEGVKSTNYNVSEKHTISAGNYPRILKAVNTLKNQNNLSIKMSAKESDLDKMENALRKNPKDETVLKQLSSYLSRLTEAHDGGPFAPTYPDPDKLPLTMDALYGLSRYDPVEVPNILDMIKIPAEYDLEEIEKILVRLKAEKGLTSTQYTDFIEREEDDQNYLKYQYLLPAEKFFDWVKSGN